MADQKVPVLINHVLVYVCTGLLSIVTWFVIHIAGQFDQMQSELQSHEVSRQLTDQRLTNLENTTHSMNEVLMNQAVKTTELNAKMDAMQDFLLQHHFK